MTRLATLNPGDLIRQFKSPFGLFIFCRGNMWFKDHELAKQCVKELRSMHIDAFAVKMERTSRRPACTCLFVEDDLSGKRLTQANETTWRYMDVMRNKAVR